MFEGFWARVDQERRASRREVDFIGAAEELPPVAPA